MNDVNESNPEVSTERAKIPKMAIASPATVLGGFLAMVVLTGWLEPNEVLAAVGFCIYLGSLLTGLVFGIIADRRIYRSRGRLRGRMFAVFGCGASLVLLLVSFIPPPSRISRALAFRLYCGTNMSGLGKALYIYANDFDGKLPQAEKWCDLLIEHGDVSLRSFLCKAVDANEGQSCYAMNRNVADKKLSDLPANVVLLFEAEPGWNQVGGPDMLIPDVHQRKGSNVLFADGHVGFVKAEDAHNLMWESWDFRRLTNDADVEYWLENMIRRHRFTDGEVRAATGLSLTAIEAEKERLDIHLGNGSELAEDAPLSVLPYPGGRHPRIGFLEGAIDPQRETKFSVFTPWDANSYVVLDIPEAIWSNLGLTYLAHTHIDTIWTAQGIELEKLEWNRRPDGGLDIERTLPNGIAFGVKVEPTKEAVLMEMWMRNGTDKKLTDLRIQNCVMPKMAKGFEQQTNDNKVLTNPYVACKSSDGKRWIITVWEGCYRPWANPDCPCFHSDPKFPDLEPGQKHTLKGRLSFYEGEDIKAEFERIEATAWRK